MKVIAAMDSYKGCCSALVAGEAVLRFQSADTRALACTAYCYDVRLHGADGSVDTIVPKNEFLVGEAVGDG